jgi:hypothetical protein
LTASLIGGVATYVGWTGEAHAEVKKFDTALLILIVLDRETSL